ncbi:hybrid sensor histidine kinase/response regulator [Prosthecomicrobium sp. N25]|uniref:hybrid sensor histidine kinase/response regulator n=1 Tax=Prosthecomicrobium sp. N25 TaxID=3129254 RepID=UPI0030783135
MGDESVSAGLRRWKLDEVARNAALAAACAAAGYLVTRLEAWALVTAGGIPALALRGPVLLAVLIRTPADASMPVLAGWLLGLAAGLGAVGLPPGAAVANVAADLSGVMILYVGLTGFGRIDMTKPDGLFAFALLALGPAPLAAALVGSAGSQLDYRFAFMNWYTGQAIGYLTILPALVRQGASALRSRPAGLDREGFLTFLAAAAAVSAVVTADSVHLLLFAFVAAAVASAICLGWAGVSTALALMAAAGVTATLHGAGPLATLDGPLGARLGLMQVFLGLNSLFGLQVAAVLESRQRAAEELGAERARALEAERRLDNRERSYRILAEHGSNGILLQNRRHETGFASPSIRALLGYTPEEWTVLDWRDIVHPQDSIRVAALKAELGPDKPQAVSTHRILRKDGAWVWIEAVYTYVPPQHSDEASILVVLRDVTELVLQKEQLEQARARAEEALQVKSRFLAVMSHELRTPLNGIIGYTNLLKADPTALSESAKPLMNRIHSASRQLLSIVNDVLDVSKGEARALELDPRPFRPRDMIEEAVAVLRDQAQAKGIAFELLVDPAVPEVLVGDDARLRQVVQNLVANSVKFTVRGFVRLAVRALQAEEGRARIGIEVRDTGIGIPEERRDRLFQPFSQADQGIARRFGGTGLGLSICREILAQMGATIRVESVLGRGSVFSFDLTLPVSAPGELAGAIDDARGDAEGPGLRILVAEDVPMNQDLVKLMLGQWGHQVDIAPDGVAAVAAASAEAYDLILMDVQMPIMDGIEATRRIRALPKPWSDVPILALTAHIFTEEIGALLRAGMDGHVGKPFVPRDLHDAIDRWGRGRAGQPLSPGAPDSHPRAEPTPQADDPGLFLNGEPVHDPAVLAELAQLTGQASRDDLLRRLAAQIQAGPGGRGPASGSGAEFKAEAHKLVSSSGMLGFRRLSALCRAIEAVPDDKVVAAPWPDLFRRSAAEAQVAIGRLLAKASHEAA